MPFFNWLIAGVTAKSMNQSHPILIAAAHVSELNEIEMVEKGIWFGASITISKFEETLQKQVECLPEPETKIYREILEMLRWFANRQIRNVSVSINSSCTE